MSLKYGLKSIKLSGGETFPFKENGITVVVGPNNSGKSTLLREIHNVSRLGLERAKPAQVILEAIILSKDGTVDDLDNFAKQNTKRFKGADGLNYVRALSVNVEENNFKNWWANANSGLQDSTPLFCFLADTQSRLSAAVPPGPVNLLTDPLTHPIHVLQDDEDVEARFSNYFKKAFGHELILNRGAGGSLPLHMGKKPEIKPGEDRISKAYLKALSELPQIQNQGDGIRSFVGCLLSTTIMNRPLTLLDEPEAFLHPPQARLLGGLLAKEHLTHQLIIATHKQCTAFLYLSLRRRFISLHKENSK